MEYYMGRKGKEKKKESHQKPLTINIPLLYYDFLDNLIEKGEYPNRSELIRTILKEFLTSEALFKEILQVKNKIIKKENVKEFDQLIEEFKKLIEKL